MLTNTEVLIALTLAIIPALLAFRLGKTLYL
nr:Photosystem I reaction center subunit XII [Cutleria multifida]YP_011006654.1 Photosystem I reaction center subunit XII [Halosiphon tomentosus]YP_011007498.1 Photosystem I reaction center subunit XII [Sporochnus bolleanus]WAM62675.1 Photosystem I reaction center subunit XII [Cutleria multifida]WAM63799.1 Photosystem I reaction center subunit XII [Halosiphon tomentosus]WAM64927.1 Photosystem I reaction center subunit XII [Sporochnus bolleanus]